MTCPRCDDPTCLHFTVRQSGYVCPHGRPSVPHCPDCSFWWYEICPPHDWRAEALALRAKADEAETADRVERYGLEQEVLALRAKVARVEALEEHWQGLPRHWQQTPLRQCRSELRAALGGAKEAGDAA